MFEKQKNDKPNQSPGEDFVNTGNSGFAKPAAGGTSVIGSSITIKGDINGEEDLVIAGRVTGNVTLSSNEVTVSSGGSVNADITAKVVKIEGEVKGDLSGNEKVVISKTGKVQGNIVAPRVTLEDGAKFKGSIDMDPGANATIELAAVKSSGKTDEPDKSPSAVKSG